MTRPAPRPDAPSRPHPRARDAFWRSEDGSLTILGLFMFVLMLTAGGVALDAMRAERQRTALQTTIDRGVLAATSLDQTRPGDEVMRDYLRAADIPEDSVTIEAFDNGSERRVAVDAVATTPSLFMDALGVDELTQTISSTAREVRTEVELSLVVDISGSMGDHDKIGKLRTAAREFVTELLQGREDRTYISIVAYNDTVNLGSVVSRFFPLTTEHDESRCVRFVASDFLRLDLPANQPILRKGHFDQSSSGNPMGLVQSPRCVADERYAVLPWSNNLDALTARINELRSTNGTAVDVGAKVGTLLLDPSSRDRLTAMANDATLPEAYRIDPVFLGRPVDYGTVGTTKILVLMTDGQNNDQRDLRADVMTGTSTVRVFQERNTGIGSECDNNGDPRGCADYDPAKPAAAAAHRFGTAGNPDRTDVPSSNPIRPHYSIWSESRRKWFVFPDNVWRDEPWGGTEAQEIPWSALLANVSWRWLKETALKNADDATRRQYDSIRVTSHTGRQADRNLSNICAAARAQGVIVYAISFQSNAAGAAALRDCAGPGNESHFYDVQTLDIDSAFDGVLASIERLRLTR